MTTEAELIRVLVADDHPVVRTGLRGVVDSMIGAAVAAEARTGVEAVALHQRIGSLVAILVFFLSKGGFSGHTDLRLLIMKRCSSQNLDSRFRENDEKTM